MPESEGWIGVDLDGTLAEYYGWVDIDSIGKPIMTMVERVRGWLDEGRDVRIFTARVGPGARSDEETERARLAIMKWCKNNIGRELPVTCVKDFNMVQLWDDRCVQVVTNTGIMAANWAYADNRPEGPRP